MLNITSHHSHIFYTPITTIKAIYFFTPSGLLEIMVRNSLQKAVFADFLLARNRFRTNYKATFLWDSSDLQVKVKEQEKLLINRLVFMLRTCQRKHI